nr:unnamed protein product [Callosobruchus analis]
MQQPFILMDRRVKKV